MNELKIKDFFLIIFYTTFFSITYYIWWILDLLSSILSLIIYSIIFYLLYIWWKRIRKKEEMNSIVFLKYFYYRVSILIIFLIVTIWWFSYYNNEISPAPAPRYYLSNWEKEVIFQTMSHIWSENYYNEVKQNIIKEKENWYVLFYEWVQWWTEENADDFNKALWIKFEKDLYDNLSKLYGLVNQDQREFLWLINDKDYNVDISIDEIMKLYNAKISDKKGYMEEQKETIDVNKMIIESLSSLNDKKLKILVYINRWILNFIIKSEETRDLISNNFWNKNLFSVILEERNKILTDEIIKNENKKIYVMYGLMHFEGVFEILKSNNPNWKIEKIENLYPVR